MDHTFDVQRSVFLACDHYSSYEPNKSICPQSPHKNLVEYRIVTADTEHADVVHVSVWLLATRGCAISYEETPTAEDRIFTCLEKKKTKNRKTNTKQNSLVNFWKINSLGGVWLVRKAVSIRDHATSDDLSTNITLGHDGKHEVTAAPLLKHCPHSRQAGWLKQPNGG